jgi:hypothetical protein
MAKLLDPNQHPENIIPNAPQQAGERAKPQRPMDFRETAIKDITRFAPQVNEALLAYATAGDGRSVWSMMMFLDGSGIPVDKNRFLELGRESLARLERADMGPDIADVHTGMRALGHKTEITDGAESSMQAMLYNARMYEDGWATTHLLHRMGDFKDLKEPPQVSDRDKQLGQDALSQARDEKDAGAIWWIHHRLRRLGERTEITLRDQALLWMEFRKAAKDLDDGRFDQDTVKTMVGLRHLYMNSKIQA